jgi:hypothetical protein
MASLHVHAYHAISSLIKKKMKVTQETQMGAVAKSYMRIRKGFLIYEEMRKYLTIY